MCDNYHTKINMKYIKKNRKELFFFSLIFFIELVVYYIGIENIGKKEADELKALGYKLCLVSPELEGRTENIEMYKKQIEDMEIEIDAVCTKSYNIEQWKGRER